MKAFRGIVLAGGLSSRMGRDKATLVYRGMTLLDHALDLLDDSGSTRNLISGDIPGYDSIPDLLPRHGPPAGIHACLHQLDREGRLDASPLVVIPVDMPLLNPTVIRRLVEACEGHAASHYAGEIFPCIVPASDRLRRHLWDVLMESDEDRASRSMKGLLEFLGSVPIPTDGISPAAFTNVNDQSDWGAIA